ncbi:MAG: protein kinase, partial [Cyanobacteria bacterium J06641_5]
MLRVKLRGRYEIIKELGSGGFSETYLARDLDFPGQPQCVVKQLKPHCDDEWGLQTARRLFDSEASVLSRLGSNDQIPQLMAYFEENQQFYLVQEFIAGHQLSEELDPERQWTEVQTIAFLEDALGILAFIHRHDVVHRDLKPENIIRRATDSRLVFIDFGAIKEITGESSSTESNLTIAVGT